MNRKDYEIMAPVGSYESLMAAINAGADSIYFGIEGLNMRSKSANNFTTEDLHKIAAICREHDVKSYLTVNTIIYDEDLALMREIIDSAKDADVSAIIAADVAPMLYARSIGVEVHLSTQLNITNVEALRFYAQFADVVVLARELNMDQVAAIHKAIIEEPIVGPAGEPIRIEMFAHGALCMAVSGKCYLSLHEQGKSANRGSCSQICRRSYEVKDKETGIELEITEEDRALLREHTVDFVSFSYYMSVCESATDTTRGPGNLIGGVPPPTPQTKFRLHDLLPKIELTLDVQC